MTGRLPVEVLDDPSYSSIHAAVLFADIQNSVLLSSSMPPLEYDDLVNRFQMVMAGLAGELKKHGSPIAEHAIAGDQLSLFFYDPEEVVRNYRLDGPKKLKGARRQKTIATCRRSNENLVYSALVAAIELKNHWLVQPFNTERVLGHHEPYDLSIGFHCGRVYLRKRPDGRRRIEGYAVNLAKRIESSSRQGRYSQIMLSQAACETIRNAVRGHTQLRQRVFFHRQEMDLVELKGVLKTQPVSELRFYHRLGIHPQPEAIPLYEGIFAVNPGNIWAYYQLVDHYGYQHGNWERVRELADRAQVVHPADERVKYDLSRCHFEAGDFDMSREYCEQALALNPDFDLAYERLGEIAATQDDFESYISYLRKAVSLSPGSAVNHLNLGLGLYQANQHAKAVKHLRTALELWPEYIRDDGLRQALGKLEQAGELPDELKVMLEEGGGQAAAR